MTTCTNGPAAGKTFQIDRAPIYMRVTEENGSFDCLNNPEDKPFPKEKLHAYRMKEFKGRAHLKFRRGGAWVTIADYELCDPQPDDSVMRDNKRWIQWAEAQPHYNPDGYHAAT
jgi:hypothetical protein